MESINTKKAISSAITQKILNDYDDEPTSSHIPSWVNHYETVYAIQLNNPLPSQKLLSFDFDGTITQDLKSDNLLYDKTLMETKIKEYLDKGYTLCLFSNQKGVSTGKAKLEDIQKKIENIFTKKLNLPISIIFSTDDDYYRKPYIGMLELFEEKYNKGTQLNRGESIFVGDAAGRKKNSYRKNNDFSDSDYKFALNGGMQFKTPEMFFLGKQEEIPKVQIDLHKYDNNNNDHINYPEEQEMIILIGSPGSGKSTFAESIVEKYKQYKRISRDDLKTEKKVLQVAETSIKEKKSVIIDCTNPSKDKRVIYINLAKKLKIKVRAFTLELPKEYAIHLNNFRRVNKERKVLSPAVNVIPIHSFYKYYEEPKTEEGFDEIVKVNFVPGPFKSEKEKATFYMYSS